MTLLCLLTWTVETLAANQFAQGTLKVGSEHRPALQGLEHTDLIKLKRTVSKQKVSPAAAAAMRNIKGEAFISRRSSGMSFDFSHRDERMYIAGTEDGHIYKCSTSYSEQYLETYSGHLGPVYRVQWSPFQSNLFISSSADWSVKLWTEGKVSAVAVWQQHIQCHASVLIIQTKGVCYI